MLLSYYPLVKCVSLFLRYLNCLIFIALNWFRGVFLVLLVTTAFIEGQSKVQKELCCLRLENISGSTTRIATYSADTRMTTFSAMTSFKLKF